MLNNGTNVSNISDNALNMAITHLGNYTIDVSNKQTVPNRFINKIMLRYELRQSGVLQSDVLIVQIYNPPV